MSRILSVAGSVNDKYAYAPPKFFTKENIEWIRKVVQQNLNFDFRNTILIDDESIVRVMQRILSERLEEIPRMNQRVIMEIVNEIRTEQIEVNKHLKWQEGYAYSQQVYDTVGKKGPDVSSIKLANRLGKPRVGGTVSFYFT